jgi:hypothetical protein
LDLAEDAPAPFQKHFTLRRQSDRPGASLKKSDTDAFLKPGDALTNGGRRYSHFPARRNKALALRGLDENLQATQRLQNHLQISDFFVTSVMYVTCLNPNRSTAYHGQHKVALFTFDRLFMSPKQAAFLKNVDLSQVAKAENTYEHC